MLALKTLRLLWERLSMQEHKHTWRRALWHSRTDTELIWVFSSRWAASESDWSAEVVQNEATRRAQRSLAASCCCDAQTARARVTMRLQVTHSRKQRGDESISRPSKRLRLQTMFLSPENHTSLSYVWNWQQLRSSSGSEQLVVWMIWCLCVTTRSLEVCRSARAEKQKVIRLTTDSWASAVLNVTN